MKTYKSLLGYIYVLMPASIRRYADRGAPTYCQQKFPEPSKRDDESHNAHCSYYMCYMFDLSVSLSSFDTTSPRTSPSTIASLGPFLVVISPFTLSVLKLIHPRTVSST